MFVVVLFSYGALYKYVLFDPSKPEVETYDIVRVSHFDVSNHSREITKIKYVSPFDPNKTMERSFYDDTGFYRYLKANRTYEIHYTTYYPSGRSRMHIAEIKKVVPK